LLCPFDPAIQLIPKVWTKSGETATIFYPAYNMSFAERSCLQQIADIVKTCCPATKSVIGYYDTREMSEPGKNARVYDWKLLDYIKQTAWIIDLPPRPLLGLFAAFAGSLSIQWSGFDIQPNRDEYSAARRHLIPYPKGGLSGTKEIAEHIVRQLTTSFNDDADRHKATGSYIKRTTEFARDYFFITPLRLLRKPLRSLRLRLYCKGPKETQRLQGTFSNREIGRSYFR
jgi:hypothetical protein